jgi:hypothetical protein
MTQNRSQKIWPMYRGMFYHILIVDDKFASFSSLFSDVIKTKAKPRPFITAEIKILMHQRDLAHRIARKTHNPRDWLIFRNIKRQVKIDLQPAESDFIKNEIQTNNNDSYSLWKLLDVVFLFETQ